MRVVARTNSMKFAFLTDIHKFSTVCLQIVLALERSCVYSDTLYTYPKDWERLALNRFSWRQTIFEIVVVVKRLQKLHKKRQAQKERPKP